MRTTNIDRKICDLRISKAGKKWVIIQPNIRKKDVPIVTHQMEIFERGTGD